MRTHASVLSTVLVALALVVGSAGTTAAEVAPREQASAGVRTVNFPGDGVRISREDQVRKLRGTSASFKEFVRKRVRYLTRHDCYEAGQVLVHRWRSDGWATADENSCGGAAFIYMRTAQGWRSPRALGTQEAYSCSVLRRFDVPPALLSTRSDPYQCYAADGTMVAYQ